MGTSRTAKRIFEWKPIGRRSPGRPRLRWLDDVCDDLEVLKVINWKKLATDRKVWNDLSEKAKTWSLTLREEHRLRVFVNRVLRRIFGPKRDEMTREWRKLHNEELHNLYSSPDILRQVKSRRMRWAGHVARMGEERKVCKVLLGKPEGKETTGKTKA
jgi:hypothetical protein